MASAPIEKEVKTETLFRYRPTTSNKYTPSISCNGIRETNRRKKQLEKGIIREN